MQNTKKGFTLIELLIVITIIGILAAALLPSILGAPVKSRDVARQAAMTTLVTAIEANVAAGGSYPAAATCIDNNFADAGGDKIADYIPGGVVPTDPSDQTITNAGSTTAIPAPGCSAGEYYYCPVAASPQTYALFALMEDPANGANIDLGAQTGGGVCADGSSGIDRTAVDGYVVVQ